MSSSRFGQGLKLLSDIDGEAGHNVIDSLQDICPDLAKFTIEYPFGDIYSRPALDIKSREIATVAALTALGHCQPQLKSTLKCSIECWVYSRRDKRSLTANVGLCWVSCGIKRNVCVQGGPR